jgi:putative ABC transport system permease protein
VLADLRYAVRILRKRPGTSGLAVFALALGIGLTTTMFSIVEGAFLRGLPFDEADRILHIEPRRGASAASGATSVGDLADWRTVQQSFESIAAVSTRMSTLAIDGDGADRFEAAAVTPNLFHLLRIRPALGRDFADRDAAPGAARVAIVSDAIWRQRFGSDRSTIGRQVRIDGVVTTIVGVAPPKFGFPETQQIWLPLDVTPPAKRSDGQRVVVVGRLAPGRTIAQAQTEFRAIGDRLSREHVEDKDTTAFVEPYLQYFLGGGPVAALTMMLIAVTGVFLIACVNVTNLQLARAAERMREIAVRTALGASRARIIRQMLVEGLLLSACGAAVGLAMAQVGSSFFNRAIVDTHPPFWIDVRVDDRVLLVVTGLAVVAALAAALVPALRVSRQPVNDVLKDEGRASTSLRIGRLSRGLVIVEMTCSFGLLAVSGLIGKSILTLGTIDYPFAVDRTFIGQVRLDDKTYPDAGAVRQATGRLRERVAALPGVRQAAIGSDVPGGRNREAIWLEGDTGDPKATRPVVVRIAVTPDYFDAIHLAMVQGRGLTTADADGTLPVAVISEDLERRFFPKGTVIGRRLRLGQDPNAPWLTIVGVVPKVAVMLQAGRATETVFLPIAQTADRGLFLVADAKGDPRQLTASVRKAVSEIDPNMALFDAMSLRDGYNLGAWPYRVFGGLFVSFGIGALVLAGAGLYGVMAFSVRRRTSEIGIRMALGADRRGILRLIVRQGLGQVAIGAVGGLILGRLLAGQMSLLLFNVNPWDPSVFAATVGVLATAGLLATIVPAVRAASVDPLVALRRD